MESDLFDINNYMSCNLCFKQANWNFTLRYARTIKSATVELA